jgi:hypothetical protein
VKWYKAVRTAEDIKSLRERTTPVRYPYYFLLKKMQLICIGLVHTYLLTPWSRVLLEKLTVNFAVSQEIPRIYGTRKFLTVPTSARHMSLSWANSIQSPRTVPTSWRSILILSSHLRAQDWYNHRKIATTVGGKLTDPVINTSLYHRMSLFPPVAIC